MNEMNEHFNNVYREYQWGFWKSHGTQHFLVLVIRKPNDIREEKAMFTTIPNSLHKAFNFISNELLLAKLDEYGFEQIRSQSWFTF